MAPSLSGGKRNAAPGAEGRFDPVNGGKAVGAETLLLLGQKRLAAITLGRQKKLEEGVEK